MTIIDHLRNLVEHKKTPVYMGDNFSMYMNNRFLSFVTGTHCQILNTFFNNQLWEEVDCDLQQDLYHLLIPKSKYNYNRLFGGYVKQPPKVVKENLKNKVNLLCGMFEISSKQALEYLEIEGVKDALDEYE